MKNSINNLRNQLTSTELLSATQLCAVKGGAGEDIRLLAAKVITTVVAAIKKVI